MNIIKRFLTSQKFYRTLRDYAGAVFASIAAGYFILWMPILSKNFWVGVAGILVAYILSLFAFAYFYNRFDKVVNKQLRTNTNSIYRSNRNFRLFKTHFLSVELGVIAAGFFAINTLNNFLEVVISSAFAVFFAIIGFFVIYVTIVVLDKIHKWELAKLQ